MSIIDAIGLGLTAFWFVLFFCYLKTGRDGFGVAALVLGVAMVVAVLVVTG